MPDEYLHPSDIRKSHVLTRIINKTIPESDVYDIGWAPLRTTSARKVKLIVKEFNPAGLASFKADNANTPVVGGGGSIREEYMELVAISEKHVLSPTDLIALNSPDINLADNIARDIVQLSRQLRIRNAQRTKWMAWQAAQDDLSITYPDGVSISIDYDLDGDNQNSDFSGSHKPTAAAGWDVASTDIITDVYNWTKLIADDLGIDQSECILHVNSDAWRYMKKNTGLKAELSSTNPRIITPTRTEVAEILEIAEIRIDNTFYKDTSNTKQKFLPDGKAFITAPYVVDGAPLIDMMDGPVVRVVNGQLVVESNAGMVVEIYVNEEQASENLRLSTARIPVMNYPAGIVWATIYS